MVMPGQSPIISTSVLLFHPSNDLCTKPTMVGIFKNILPDQISDQVRQRSRKMMEFWENSFDVSLALRLTPHMNENSSASDGRLSTAWEQGQFDLQKTMTGLISHYITL